LNHSIPSQDSDDDLSSMLSSFQAGDTVLHYHIIDAIGEGGMGEVYKAEDLKLGRIVALKVLSPSLKKDQTAGKRLILEARSVSALNHPHIVTIHAIEEWNGIVFLAMEFLEGRHLGIRMAISPLSLSDLLEIGAQTAEALGAAHAAGLIHRDVKPQNIMITSEEPVQIKLLDFGLAKKIPKLQEETGVKEVTRLTTAGIPIGTIPYMSPEQTRAETLDSRTDIFSLGITLYEAATRVLPFEGNSVLSTMDNIANADPLPPSEIVPDLPPEFDEIILHALVKEKEDRLQSAFDFARRLRELKYSLGPDFQEPIHQPPIPPRSSRSIRTSERRPVVTKSSVASEAPSLSSAESIAAKAVKADETYAVQGIRNKKAAMIGLIGLLIFLGMIGGAAIYFSRESDAIHSMAVLPFANANANPQDEYLSEGITESIINSLSQIPRLRVMARTTVFRYEGKRVDPRQVGHDLHLDAVVTGSIYRQGDILIVTANLVRVTDGTQIWGDQYNRTVSDMLAVQSEISKVISEKLRLKLTGAEEQRVAKKYTVNPEAYEAYLRGIYFWNRRTVDFDHMRRALEYFQLAAKKDPNYALAYAGMSDAYTILGNFQVLPVQEAYAKAEESIKKAITLDDSLAEAHISFGGLRESQLDWKSAGIEYEKGLLLKPNYPTGQEWFGLYLIEIGRTDEGVSHIKEALALDPFALIMNACMGLAYYYQRDYDRAIEAYRKTLELDPNQSLYGIFAEVYGQKRMYDEMVAEYLREYRLPFGKSHEKISEYEAAYKKGGILGWRQKNLEEELIEAAQGKHYFQVAMDYAALGKKDEAFHWLQKAVDEKNVDLWMFRIKVDPRCDPLRSDPRFDKILHQLGLM
jgi:serine/threonine protein kinase/tetratricopeptide (TPR) repeat protein